MGENGEFGGTRGKATRGDRACCILADCWVLMLSMQHWQGHAAEVLFEQYRVILTGPAPLASFCSYCLGSKGMPQPWDGSSLVHWNVPPSLWGLEALATRCASRPRQARLSKTTSCSYRIRGQA